MACFQCLYGYFINSEDTTGFTNDLSYLQSMSAKKREGKNYLLEPCDKIDCTDGACNSLRGFTLSGLNSIVPTLCMSCYIYCCH